MICCETKGASIAHNSDGSEVIAFSLCCSRRTLEAVENKWFQDEKHTKFVAIILTFILTF
jgi:hypothetical protein